MGRAAMSSSRKVEAGQALFGRGVGIIRVPSMLYLHLASISRMSTIEIDMR